MYYSTPKIPPVVKGLIIANVAVFVLQLLPIIGDIVFRMGAMVPAEAFYLFQFWRFGTYMFLHSPDMLFHIMFNMLALWWFGAELEDIWGGKKFLIFYIICGVGAGLFSFFYLFMNPDVFVIGASGAVLGVLTAYAFYYPSREVLLFFVLPIKIRTLVIGYAVFSVLFSLRGGGYVSHLTHLGGIVIAWIYMNFLPKIKVGVGKWIYSMRVKSKSFKARY